MVIEKRGRMTPEQVECYRKAAAPVQESFLAAKSARLGALSSLRTRGSITTRCGTAADGQK